MATGNRGQTTVLRRMQGERGQTTVLRCMQRVQRVRDVGNRGLSPIIPKAAKDLLQATGLLAVARDGGAGACRE